MFTFGERFQRVRFSSFSTVTPLGAFSFILGAVESGFDVYNDAEIGLWVFTILESSPSNPSGDYFCPCVTVTRIKKSFKLSPQTHRYSAFELAFWDLG